MIKNTKNFFLIISLSFFLSISSYASSKEASILEAYANIAFDNYSQALKDAKELKKAIDNFASKPTQKNYDAARVAWLNSRESYGSTEIFRLSNGPIDSKEGWVYEAYGSLEEEINSWPLDENMIDYTIDASGKLTSGNIIDTIGKFTPEGEDAKTVDVTKITAQALTDLNQNGGDANVTTGYHAIEFLLWGQDQDYENFLEDKVANGPMTAGQRPLTDFTTDKYAKRRLQYLQVASQKLIDDLQVVTSAWEKKVDGNKGLYRAALLGELKGKDKSKNIDQKTALKQIVIGMGVFIKSELANERIAVAVLTPSEEDEQSCFSDNTHRDIVKNYEGFKNVLYSTYNGKKYGKSLFDAVDKETKSRIKKLMAQIEEKIESVDRVAKTEAHFDYQIRPDHPQSKVLVKLKNELRKLGDEMVNIGFANGIILNTDDVTDPEETKI